MADTTTTPNMNLPVPVPETAPGPAWATNVVADMYAIDSHNHSSGQGVPVTPDGMNISSDLAFGDNNATGVKSAIFTAQSAPLSGGSYLGCVYVSGKDLYYNDEDGNQVRITTGGNVNAGAGSITGLPSGTASVAFSGGTFTFQSATSTGATISCGPVAIGSTTASARHTTLASNAAQVADISLVLPTASPSAPSVMKSDASGNMSWAGVSGTGSVVLDTGPSIASATLSSPTMSQPNVTGVPTGTITGGSYSPTVSNTTGTTTAAGTWFYQRIGNNVTVAGSFTTTPSAGVVTFTASLPLNPTSNFAAVTNATGTLVSFNSSVTTTAQESALVQATVSAKTITVTMIFPSSAARDCAITFAYSCV